MPGRLHQAATRHDGVMRRRMALLAEKVANGASIRFAGSQIGLTVGETSRCWQNIKADLGEAQCR